MYFKLIHLLLLLLLLFHVKSSDQLPHSRNLDLFVDVTPHFVSVRNNESRQIRCSAVVRDKSDPEADIRFFQPKFEWQFDQRPVIVSKLVTCDRSRIRCWSELVVEADQRIKHQLQVKQESKFSCVVTDFIESYSDGVKDPQKFRLAGQHHAHFSSFSGKRLGENCNQNSECFIGHNLICLKKKCHCSGLLIPVVNEFEESICISSAKLNESCKYDQQCSSWNADLTCNRDTSRCECAKHKTLTSPECVPEKVKPTQKLPKTTEAVVAFPTNLTNVNETLLLTRAEVGREEHPEDDKKKDQSKSYFSAHTIWLSLGVFVIAVVVAIILRTKEWKEKSYHGISLPKLRMSVPPNEVNNDQWPPNIKNKDLQGDEDILFQTRIDKKRLVGHDALSLGNK